MQTTLEHALSAAYRRWDGLSVAGRTDAGVHAAGQVASVAVEGGPPPGRAAAALSSRLPPDLAVRAAEQAPAGFDARASARSRLYAYRVLAARARSPLREGRVHLVRGGLDREALEACAAALPGEHSFRAFTPTETQHRSFRREVRRAAWIADGDELRFEIEADAFLRHMVRTLVGTMLQVGTGGRPVDSFTALLRGAPRAEGGPTAPAHGLCLVGVRY